MTSKHTSSEFTRTTRVLRLAQDLFLTMPGAPIVPICDGLRMWGEVEGSDHWNFCAMIANAIVDASEGRS